MDSCTLQERQERAGHVLQSVGDKSGQDTEIDHHLNTGGGESHT